jgi:hypothetical protein
VRASPDVIEDACSIAWARAPGKSAPAARTAASATAEPSNAIRRLVAMAEA